MALPEWVLKYKQKNHEIKKIQDKYYLYHVSSYYDKEKKRTIKKSGAYIGRITEDGLVPKGTKQPSVPPGKASVKEEGASALAEQLLSQEKPLLQQYFPDAWQEILLCTIFRLLYQSSFKQMNWHLQNCSLTERYDASLSPSHLSAVIKEVGRKREDIVEVMKGLYQGAEHLLIDSTHITSYASNNLSAQLGYNSQRQFDPQVNLLYIFAHDAQMPLFYRCLPGSIREVRSLCLTLKESGINNALLVSDKGFYSQKNVEELDLHQWDYILPLRRNAALIDYQPTTSSGLAAFDGMFLFEERIIWYKKTTLENNKHLFLFLDEGLRVQESKDYLTRVLENKEGYSLELYHQKEHRFGTIAVLTSIKNHHQQQQEDLAQTIFHKLKTRHEIEQLNDTYKNVLQADRSYMHSEEGMEAWHFINYLALRVYYKIFLILKQQNLTGKYSVADVLLLLRGKKKITIGGVDIEAEVPKKTQQIIDKLFNYEQNKKTVT